jgi:fused signal recognition particle receptor
MSDLLHASLQFIRAQIEAYPPIWALLTLVAALLALLLLMRRRRRSRPETDGEVTRAAPMPRASEAPSASALPAEIEEVIPPPVPGPEAAPPEAPPREEAGAVETARPPQDAIPRIDLEPPEGFVGRLRRGLAKTQQAFVGRLDALLRDRGTVDEDILEEIEEILYTADLGVATARKLLDDLRARTEGGATAASLLDALREEVQRILASDAGGAAALAGEGPHVVMFVGVNGVGKTTTIGKVAAQHVAEGRRVILAAADTFRAAAIEQLEIWGERIGSPVIKQKAGSDPSAVAFDAVAAAKSRRADLLLVDTAGRMHTKVNLMEELKKMKRVLGRELPGAPHEIILVMDATTGQNGLSQARQFHEAVGVTGIALTKLDGTAKGGIVIAVHAELKLPIRYIGVGEKLDDLRPFDARAFVDALFARH